MQALPQMSACERCPPMSARAHSHGFRCACEPAARLSFDVNLDRVRKGQGSGFGLGVRTRFSVRVSDKASVFVVATSLRACPSPSISSGAHVCHSLYGIQRQPSAASPTRSSRAQA
eukprot:3464988-Pleurochrysis_carterae.AAC.2